MSTGPRTRHLRSLVAVVAASLAISGCGSTTSSTSDAPAAPSRAVGTRLDGPIQSSIDHLELRDHTGRTHTLASLRGKVLMISDSMTLCQETCPLDTSSLLQTARAVDEAGLGDKVEFLTVTVDPKRDTSAQLAAYRRQFSPAPDNWLTLTGRPADIATLWKTLGVYTKQVPEEPGETPRNWRTGQPLTYDVEHADQVFFFDADQHERFILDGVPAVGGRREIPKELYRFMSAEGHRNVTRPGAQAWTVPQALQVVSWLVGHRVSA